MREMEMYTNETKYSTNSNNFTENSILVKVSPHIIINKFRSPQQSKVPPDFNTHPLPPAFNGLDLGVAPQMFGGSASHESTLLLNDRIKLFFKKENGED